MLHGSRWIFLAALALGGWALSAPEGSLIAPAGATTMVKLTLEQMVDASDLIAIGTVTDSWGALGASGRLETRTQITVGETLKGSSSSVLEVMTPGGTMDDMVSVVPGAPRFGVGESVLVFLQARSDGRSYLTIGLIQGKFSIKQNPADGAEMVVNFTAPQDRPWDFRFIPNPPLAERVSLETMKQKVLARVSLGWDGQPIPGISAEKLRSINNLQSGVR